MADYAAFVIFALNSSYYPYAPIEGLFAFLSIKTAPFKRDFFFFYWLEFYLRKNKTLPVKKKIPSFCEWLYAPGNENKPSDDYKKELIAAGLIPDPATATREKIIAQIDATIAKMNAGRKKSHKSSSKTK